MEWFRLSAFSTRVGCATIVSIAICSISAWLQVSYFFSFWLQAPRISSRFVSMEQVTGLMCKASVWPVASCALMLLFWLTVGRASFVASSSARGHGALHQFCLRHPLHCNRRWLIAIQARLSQIRLSRLKVNEASCTTACCVHCMV